MSKFQTFRRLFATGRPRAVFSQSWVVLGKWWRQGEPWELRKSQYVRLDKCRIGLDDPVAKSVQELLKTGIFERPERAAIRKYLDSNLPVVEFGGCIGVVACATNRLLRDRTQHVVVEANPDVTPILESNRHRNRSKFVVLQRAVGYDSAFIDLHVNDAHVLGSSTRGRGGRIISVPAITLGEIVAKFKFDYCSLICDIEGMEVELVKHESALLAKTVALIVMEVHDRLLGASPVQEMMGRLSAIGFDTIHRHHDTFVLKNRHLA